MTYPSMNDYHDSIQNPHISFIDPELQASIVAKTPLGLPRVASGGFALTYRLSNGNKNWAIRCFHKEVPDLQDRYNQISLFLKQEKSPFFVDFEYQKNGIKANNASYPVIKMDWLDGQLLNLFIEKNIGNTSVLIKISQQFRKCIQELEKLGVAHGDLQHGNIIISNNDLKLIDYDGMFVPSMSYKSSNELGHINYQHPLREQSVFDSKIDRFSSIVIFLALEALQHSPALWNKYDNGENLLFRRADFLSISKSALISDLRCIAPLNQYLINFEKICNSKIDNVPSLDEFINGTFNIADSELIELPFRNISYKRQYEIIDSQDTKKILKNVGNVVEIVGQILEVKLSRTKFGAPYAFLNFGDYKNKCFTIVLWSESLVALRGKNIDINTYKGKWVTVTQLIDKYKGTPQIILDSNTRINVLKGSEEARLLLTETAYSFEIIGTKRKSNKEIIDSLGINQSTKTKKVQNPSATIVTPITKTKNQLILEQLNKVSGTSNVHQAKANKTITNSINPVATNNKSNAQQTPSIFLALYRGLKKLFS